MISRPNGKQLPHTRDHILVRSQEHGDRLFNVESFASFADAINEIVSIYGDADNQEGDLWIQFPYQSQSITAQIDFTPSGGWGSLTVRGLHGGNDKNVLDTAVYTSSTTDGTPAIKVDSATSNTVFRDFALRGNNTDEGGLVWGGNDNSELRMVDIFKIGGGVNGDFALKVTEMGDAKLRNIMVNQNSSQYAILAENGLYVENSECSNNNIGMYLNSGGKIRHMEYEQDHIGAYADGGSLTVFGSQFKQSGSKSIYASPQTDEVRLQNCGFSDANQDNDGGGEIHSKSKRVIIEDCSFGSVANGGYHLNLTNKVEEARIQGNMWNATPVLNVSSAATDIHIEHPSFNEENNVDIVAGGGVGIWDGTNTEYTTTFDCSFTHYPRIADLANVDITGHTFSDTDSDGNIEEMTVSFASTPSYYSWEAIPRNVGS